MIKTRVAKTTSETFFCSKCKGKCWNPKDNTETQRAALSMFGIIPNRCVNGQGNVAHCPHA